MRRILAATASLASAVGALAPTALASYSAPKDDPPSADTLIGNVVWLDSSCENTPSRSGKPPAAVPRSATARRSRDRPSSAASSATSVQFRMQYRFATSSGSAVHSAPLRRERDWWAGYGGGGLDVKPGQSPVVAGIIGAWRAWTVAMISALSIPCR
jgi:hypothetical protein